MSNYLEPQDDGLSMRPSGKWVAEKLDYLARYIDVFEKSMKQRWLIRNHVDLLARPGKNRVKDAGDIFLGSPLIALTTTNPFTSYFFVDYSAENTTALQTRCAASSQHSRVHISTGDCNILVDGIVSQIKQDDTHSLNLGFLDPEGMELNWATVAKLARIRRMDLIINYPQGGLNRYMPRAFQSKDQTRVDDFFGDQEWRKIYDKYQKKELQFLHRQLMDHYKSKLQALGYKVFRDDEVEDEPLMRNAQKNAPLYRLLFASKHVLGREFWQKITRRDVHGQARLPEM